MFIEPLLVDVREARRLLGNISNNAFWRIARAGELELVGTTRKRWVTVESIRDHVERMRAAAAAKRDHQHSQMASPVGEGRPAVPR